MNWQAVKERFADPDFQDRLGGIGMALGALDQGRVADLSRVRQRIDDRATQAAATASHAQMLGNDDMLAQFTPEQRAMLASLPPQAAQQIIAETLFAPAPEATAGVNVGGNLVNPQTGEVIYSAPAESPELPSSVREAMWRAEQGGLVPGTPEYQAFITEMDGGQTINVNTGEGNTMPDGFVSIDEKTGLAVILDPASPTGVRQVPIPGGAADIERQAAADQAAAEELESVEQDAMLEDRASTTSTAITGAVDAIFEADNSRLLRGAAGEVVSGLGGTQNREIMNHLNTLKGSGAFAALQAMREASPTGGALGSVSAPELELLVATAGALDPASPNFQRDLTNYEKILMETIHGVENGRAIFAENQVRRFGGDTQTQAPVPEQDMSQLSDAELQAIIDGGQ